MYKGLGIFVLGALCLYSFQPYRFVLPNGLRRTTYLLGKRFDEACESTGPHMSPESYVVTYVVLCVIGVHGPASFTSVAAKGVPPQLQPSIQGEGYPQDQIISIPR